MRWSHVSTFVLATAFAAATPATPATAAPKASCEAVRAHARYAAFFDHVELEKLAQTVADATCKTFILTESVKGKISLVGPETGPDRLTADEFYAAFVAALDANGLAVVASGRFLRVVDKGKAKGHALPLLEPGASVPSGDEMMTRILRLRHVELDQAKGLLAQFVSQGADLATFPPDLLIVSDLASNLSRMERLLTAIDVERPSDETLRVLEVHHADAQAVAEEIQRMFAPKPKSNEVLTVLADERTNRIVVWATPWSLAQASKLVDALDLATPSQTRAHVYTLVNSEAKEIAANLEALVGPRSSRAAGAGGSAAVTTSEVKISANESLNALIVVASTGDYRSIAEVIRELDAPRRQVFIETVIMEVNAERDHQLGVSGHVVLNVGGLPIALGSEPAGATSSFSLASLTTKSGLLAGVQGAANSALTSLLGVSVPSFGLALQAVDTDSDLNVLSTPHILTTDNKEAEISVGQRIPFQSGTNSLLSATGTGTTTGLTSTTLGTSVTRERVELKLTVKPHIGEGDTVRLELNQQAEELAGENSLGPITTTRAQRTTIVARDDETVVLGGIMQDRTIESLSKTPVLGDIPLLGNLFRFTSKKKVKVDLLVFLTPHLVRDPGDVRRILERKEAERQRVLEQLYGRVAGFELAVDFTRKRGPLAALAQAVAAEARRPENGGEGAEGERIIGPEGALPHG